MHGTKVSFSTDGAMAVKDGNFQIFENFVQSSRAAFHPNTSVRSISFQKGSNKPGSIPKYVLAVEPCGSKGKSSSAQRVYDGVVIASPWQFSGIEAAGDVIKHRIESVPYTKLHVTLFTSPLRLQASYFGLEPGTRAPSNVYTTLGKDETARAGAEGVGRAGFYSISTLRTALNPSTQRKEFLYKIFSAEPVNSTFLSAILGTTIQLPPSDDVDESPTEVKPISWYYPHWFYSYPIELPRVTFQDPIVGRGLYYTSGIESFISTMETSALMGMNVARLMADDFAGITRAGRGRSNQRPPTPREDFWDSMDDEMAASMAADEL